MEMVNNLIQTKKDQVSYDICEQCGALWLDAGELDKMAFQVGNGDIEYCSERPADQPPDKSCPRCKDTFLDKVVFLGYSDIILDRCKNCNGFWLSGGELDVINTDITRTIPVTGKGFSEVIHESNLPYWYKRVKRNSSETDFSVPVLPVDGAILKGDADLQCPVCRVNFNKYEIYGMEIKGCPNCRGMWLLRDELRKLKDQVDKDSWGNLRWMDNEIEALDKTVAIRSSRFCPICSDVQLVSTKFGQSNIIIDYCFSCKGTWLDRGEFQEIISYLRSELDHFTSKDMKQKVYEEIKRIWGGPEDKFSAILDAKAAISAFLMTSIFEHPELLKRLNNFSNALHSAGL